VRRLLDAPSVRLYLTYMRTTISSKGQVVLPVELREQDHIRPGQQFSIERLESGEYLLKKLVTPGRGGTAEWLLSCPEKEWFRPLESESTDTLG
jgi:AbrB family looped-hinge helix DNA binding protein